MPIIKEEIHDNSYENTNNCINESGLNSRKFSCSSNDSSISSNDFVFEQQFINNIINPKEEPRQTPSVFGSAASEVQLRFAYFMFLFCFGVYFLILIFTPVYVFSG